MKNSYRSRWAAVLAGLFLLVPLVGSAQDHVVPPAGHEKMVNAGIKVMPRPKAWDDINTPLTAAVTAKNPLVVDYLHVVPQPIRVSRDGSLRRARAGVQREGQRQVRLPYRNSRPELLREGFRLPLPLRPAWTWSGSPSAAEFLTT